MNITGKDSGLRSVLGRVRGTLTSALAGIGRIAGLIGGAGGAIGVGFAVKLAADAEEMQSKFEAVFKELTGDAEKFALDFSTKIGRSVIDTKKQLSEFQDVLVPLGFARNEAAELSKALIKASTDLASFNNKSDEQAARALLKALTGQVDMFSDLGLTILESDVKLKLMSKGQEKLTGNALKQAKALATLDLVLQGSSDALGDAERTSGSFTNQLKRLQGMLKDTAAAIGSAFLPALALMSKKATGTLKGVLPLIKDWAKNFAKWGQVIVENWSVTWGLIKNTMTIAFEFIKSTFFQLPKIWAFVQGKSLRLLYDMLKTVGEMLLEFVKKLPSLLLAVVKGAPISGLI